MIVTALLKFNPNDRLAMLPGGTTRSQSKKNSENILGTIYRLRNHL